MLRFLSEWVAAGAAGFAGMCAFDLIIGQDPFRSDYLMAKIILIIVVPPLMLWFFSRMKRRSR